MGSSFESEQQRDVAAHVSSIGPSVPRRVVRRGGEPDVPATGRAVLVGLGVALAGGLAWAAAVIATGFDIGILAWLIGAGTSLAIARVTGGPIRLRDRLFAGGLAAGGIVVGKYVIFVHGVRISLGTWLAARGLSAGYFDTQQVSIFVHNFRHVVQPVYVLWIGLAFFAAVRAQLRPLPAETLPRAHARDLENLA
jgi:hypothetical protein